MEEAERSQDDELAQPEHAPMEPAPATLAAGSALKQATDQRAGATAAAAERIGRTEEHAIGLDSPGVIAAFAAEMHVLQAEWSQLAAEERAERLTAMANRALAEAGVPPCKLKIRDLGPVTNGQFNTPSWSLLVSQRLVRSATLSEEQAAELADALLHESRHAEQDFLMARLGVGGKDARDHIFVAPELKDAAAQQPMDPNSPQAKSAARWFESMYGKGYWRNIEVSEQMAPLTAAYEKARDRWKQFEHSSGEDPSRAAAEKEMLAAKAAMWANYNEYRARPEEADACSVGTAVKKAYKGEDK